MTLPPITDDLTRWNRAGLPRLAYVDANAVTHLDAMRAALAERFGDDWRRVADDPQVLDEVARRARALERYLEPVGDSAWELLRATARAMHVISRHVDAYASEAFLGTATQLESVRRIVSLLDHHPAGPSSATTTLAFDVAVAEHEIAPATALKHQPDDAPKVVFETRYPLTALRSLNALVDVDADDNQHPITNPLPLADDVPLVVGAPLVLQSGAALSVHRVVSVARDAEGLPTVELAPDPATTGWQRGATVVHVNPRDRLTPIGPRVTTLGTDASGRLALTETPAGIGALDTVWIQDATTTTYRRVSSVDETSVKLGEPVSGLSSDAVVGKAVETWGKDGTGTSLVLRGDWEWLEGRAIGVRSLELLFFLFFGDPSQPAHVAPAALQPTRTVLVASAVYDAGAGNGETTLTWGGDVGFAPLVALVQPMDGVATGIRVDAPLAAGAGGGPPRTLTTTGATHTENGDLVVLADPTDAAVATASSVAALSDGTTSVSTGAWTGGGTFHPATTTLYGHFADTTRPRDWNVNTLGRGGLRELNVTPRDTDALDVAAFVATLRPGRTVIVDDAPPAHEPVGGTATPLTTTVTRAETRTLPDGRTAVDLVLAAPVPAGVTAGSLVLRANAVEATHGESRSPVVVGSGSADKVFQEFTLRVTDVSHVPTPQFSSGFAPDVVVTVDGAMWTQVERLQDGEEGDRWYTARLDPDGQVVLTFGDGTTGRRLPTGVDNVRVSYRTGAGLAGNVTAGSLVELVRPDDDVAAMHQSMAATGGGSGDTVDDVRENAPRSTLALGRAVSLSDHAALAARRPDVWQATALRGTSRRGVDEVVDVVVVPAGGGALADDQRGRIIESLLAASPPGVQVDVRGHTPVPVTVSVTVHVDPAAYLLEDVRIATEALLRVALDVARRPLGQDLSRSELFRLAESVVGVEVASVSFDLAPTAALVALGVTRATIGTVDADGTLRRLRAARDQLIALRADPPGLTVTATEYRP